MVSSSFPVVTMKFCAYWLLIGVSIITPWSISASTTRILSDQPSLQNHIMQNKRQLLQHQRVSPLSKIFVLYDTTGIDKEMQQELVKGAFMALRDIDAEDIDPKFVDVGTGVNEENKLSTAASWVYNNGTSVIVSLLSSEALQTFSVEYQSLVSLSGRVTDQTVIPSETIYDLTVVTPRLYPKFTRVSGVKVLSMQMSELGVVVALLNRVEKVGIRTLIPVMDGSEYEREFLKRFEKYEFNLKKQIRFTSPIVLSETGHLERLRDMLEEHTGIRKDKVYQHDGRFEQFGNETESFGILLLASHGSYKAIQVAAEKNHMHLGWFSPNFIEHEEIRTRSLIQSSGGNGSVGIKDNFYGMYSVAFVGSRDWDNADRRRTLLEIGGYTGTSPRALAVVLAYDSAWLARNLIKNEAKLPMTGLSGLIYFDAQGYRAIGSYFGISSVPTTVPSQVTLLQPSTWILEDIITVSESKDIAFVADYDIATSSILTRTELLSLANHTKSAGCQNHLMNVLTHDPFTQKAYNYYFQESNLPNAILVPNHNGFGVTFLCDHEMKNGSDEEPLTSSLKIACTPGGKYKAPIKCFRSHFNLRQKRSTYDPYGNNYNGVKSNGWENHNHNNLQWDRDDSVNTYYQQPPPSYYYPSSGFGDSATIGPLTTNKMDIPIDSEPPTTPATPAPKLPELRQVLKAAKPFVGSCIGSTTGCAMCVLVLGRLPLGVLPAACAGPCFVGTFGSCGSLLGRVFSETTVICTELFKQGFIDIDTFIADAEFGKNMLENSPTVLQGYQLLATPLVKFMQTSTLVSYIVSIFAVPWAHHMKYLMGHSSHSNILGSIVHIVGTPVCYVAGEIYNLLRIVSLDFTPTVSLIILFISSFLVTAMIHCIISKKKSPLALFVRSSLKKALFHFQAMGRRI